MLLKYAMPVLAVLTFGLSIWSVKRLTPEIVEAKPISTPPTASYSNQIGAVGLIESASENIAVSLPIPGLVTRVAVAAGDDVKKGQLLFSLDDRDLRAELAVRQNQAALAKARLAALEASPRPEEIPPAEARVSEARAMLADAQVQLQTLEAVRDPRAIRREDLMRRRRAVESAEAKVQEAEAQLKLLKAGTWRPNLEVAQAEWKLAEAEVHRVEADLTRLQVAAPVTGRILQCKVRVGEYAQIGPLSQPLILMGQVNQWHIRADIDEKDAWRFEAGAAATGSVRGNASRKYPLQFVRVEPYVVPKRNLTGDSTERVDTRVLQVLYALPEGSNLYAGQQMDLSIEAKKGDR